MGTEFVLVENADQILTVTINRPESLNALNHEVMSSLNEIFSGLDDTIRGVILTGSGEKAFVAGADIKGFKFDHEDSLKLGAFGHETFRKIEGCKVPVLAAVNGYALGGGCELAMSCHMRIASVNARFGQPEINLGIIPGYGGSQRLPQLIGKGRAIEMLLTGDMISASDALQWGLVNHVVEPDQLMNTCRELMSKIIAKAPLATSKIIELVNKHYYNYDAGMEAEINAFAKCFMTGDAREGITAFIEKRKPNFQGK